MYIKGTVQLDMTIYLPVDDSTCRYCPACIDSKGRLYRYCFFTEEPLPAFDKTIGAECPVCWEEVN